MFERPPVRRCRHFARAASTILAALALLAGCDTASNSANKQAQKEVVNGLAFKDSGGPDAQERAVGMISGAARIPDISPQTEAYCRATLAHVQAEAARAGVRQIREQQLQYDRLCYEIGELLTKVDALRATRAAYQKFDPRPTQDGITKLITDVQGAANAPNWAGLGVDGVPSLAKATAEVARLQAALSKNKEQQRSLTDQRNAKLDEAEQAQKSADAAQGQASLDEFTRASNLRKDAGDLSIQLDGVTAAAEPLQNDLAVAQAQQAQLQETIRLLHEQSEALDSDFKSLQDQAAAQETLQNNILGAAGDTGSAAAVPATQASELANTIAAKAAALAALGQQIAANRTQAQTNFNGAADNFEQAAKAGTVVQRDMERLLSDPGNIKSKFRPIWEATRDAFHPNVYRLREAVIEREGGNLLTSAARTLQRRVRLQEQAASVLAAAGMEVPKDLADASVAADLQTVLTSADDRYKAADDALENIVQGVGVPAVQSAAKVDRVLTLYDWTIAARVAGDPSKAKTHLADALQQKTDAQSQGAVFPPLPPELQPPASATPSVPATGT